MLNHSHRFPLSLQKPGEVDDCQRAEPGRQDPPPAIEAPVAILLAEAAERDVHHGNRRRSNQDKERIPGPFECTDEDQLSRIEDAISSDEAKEHHGQIVDGAKLPLVGECTMGKQEEVRYGLSLIHISEPTRLL